MNIFLDEIDQSLNVSERRDSQKVLETHLATPTYSTTASTDTFVTCHLFNSDNDDSRASSRNETPIKQPPLELNVTVVEQQSLSPESHKQVCLVTPTTEIPSISGVLPVLSSSRQSKSSLKVDIKGFSRSIFPVRCK